MQASGYLKAAETALARQGILRAFCARGWHSLCRESNCACSGHDRTSGFQHKAGCQYSGSPTGAEDRMIVADKPRHAGRKGVQFHDPTGDAALASIDQEARPAREPTTNEADAKLDAERAVVQRKYASRSGAKGRRG